MSQQFKNKIEELIEQRTIKSVTEKVPLKLYTIAKILGKPVVTQHNDVKEFNTDRDGWIYDPIEYEEITDWATSLSGFYFDGLRYGVNLCILTSGYTEDENKFVLTEIKATYNGYVVFHETDGELQAYAPFAGWETYLNSFYEAADQKEKKMSADKIKERKENNQSKINEFFQKFKNLWGF